MRSGVTFHAAALPQTREAQTVRPTEGERFTVASLALEEVVQLLNPDAVVHRDLFPHGIHVSRHVRLGQLAFTGIQLLGRPFMGRHVAAICGEGLAYQNGWVRISLQSNWWSVLGAIFRLQPALLVSVPDGSVPEFFVRTGIDPKSDLSSFINQNGHPVIRGRRDEGQCVIHYGKAAASRAAVRRHTTGLAGAHAMLGKVLPGLLPTVYAERCQGDAAVLIQQELPGKEPQITSLTDQQLEGVMTAALAPLKAIYRHFSNNLGPFNHDDFLNHDVPQLFFALPEYRQDIEPSIALLRNWIARRKPGAIATHGDYAPRNLLLDPVQPRVVGIIDWEWFWKHGIAGFDALKLLLEVGADRQRTTLIRTLARFIETQSVDGCLMKHLQIIEATYGMSRDDLRHIAIIIWLRVLWMGCVETSPSTPKWLDETVLIPAKAIATALQSV